MRLVAVFVLSAATVVSADSLQTTFEQAVQALSSQDYVRAEQGFQTVLKAKPGNLGALGNLGVVYSRTHQYGKAIQVYRLALHSAPADEGLLLNLGLAYLKQEQYSNARPLFAKIADAHPANAQAQQLLATCQLYTGQVAEAVHRLESLRATQPRDVGVLYLLGLGYYRLGEKDKASALATEMMAASTSAQANFLMGRAAYEAGLFEEAAGYLVKAVTADSKIVGGHRELGKTYISLRQPDAASSALKLAIAADANDAEALYFLGGTLVQDGNFETAVGPLEKARALNPDFWGNYYYLGRVRLAQQKPREAVQLLNKALLLNPDEAAVYYQLSRALKLSGRTDESQRALAKVKELKAGKLEQDAVTFECPASSVDASAPKLMSNLKPFAEAVRSTGYDGVVQLQLTVTASGDIGALRISPERLESVAVVMQIVRGWRFCPAIVSSKARATPFNINVDVSTVR